MKNKIDLSKPHLSNLNEDPQLSRKINYSIDSAKCTIGRRNAEPPNDIEIGGMGIRNLQATIEMNEQGFPYIDPNFTGQDSGCYLNGSPILERTELFNLDRLTFGTNNMFIVSLPGRKPREEGMEEKTIDWEYTQNELYLKKEIMEREAVEERERKIKEQTQAILRKKEEELAMLQKTLQESEEMRKNIEQQKENEKAEMEKKLKE